MEEIMHKEMSPKKGQNEILRQYGIAPGNYAVSVCRIEPENNSHLILKAFATSGKNLVFVGKLETERIQPTTQRRILWSEKYTDGRFCV